MSILSKVVSLRGLREFYKSLNSHLILDVIAVGMQIVFQLFTHAEVANVFWFQILIIFLPLVTSL